MYNNSEIKAHSSELCDQEEAACMYIPKHSNTQKFTNVEISHLENYCIVLYIVFKFKLFIITT